MMHVVVSVFDMAAGTFGRPFHVAALGLAIRSFTDEVNRAAPDNPLHCHPGDFVLFRLGSFDDDSGRFTSLDVPERVSTGEQVKVA